MKNKTHWRINWNDILEIAVKIAKDKCNGNCIVLVYPFKAITFKEIGQKIYVLELTQP